MIFCEKGYWGRAPIKGEMKQKRIETKSTKTKQNETKRNQQKRNETKRNQRNKNEIENGRKIIGA